MKQNENKAFKCKKCGKITFPRRAVCLKCKAREFEEVPMGTDATLLTYSQIYQLPWGINDRFLTIGVCQFENGAKAMGRITTPDVENGMKMKASWEIFRQIAGEDEYGWIFQPAKL
jgi:uncharacterized OB-fold protein